MGVPKLTLSTDTVWKVLRLSDHEVFSRIEQMRNDLRATSLSVSLILIAADGESSGYIPIASGSKDDWSTLVATLTVQASLLVRRFKVVLPNGVTFLLDRTSRDGVPLADTSDTMRVQAPPDASGVEHLSRLVKVVADLRGLFTSIADRPYLDRLDDIDRVIYEAREKDLQRLESLQFTFFESLRKNTEINERKQRRFLARQRADAEAYRRELEQEVDERRRELDDREKQFEKTQAEFAKRESENNRRVLGKTLAEDLKAMGNDYGVSRIATSKERILVITLSLISALFIGLDVLVYTGNTGGILRLPGATPNAGQPDVPSGTTPSPGLAGWLMQASLTIASLTTLFFLVRVLHRRFQHQLDEETRIRRLHIDIQRSSWLVELAEAWHKQHGQEIPEHVLDRFSRNLFSWTPDSQATDIHPVETLVSGLVGQKGKAALKYPGGGELSVERQ